MKVEILSVVEKECLEITTNEPLPMYRRYGPDHWCIYLGPNHGWNRYRFTEFLEESYQKYLKDNAKQAKPPAKTNK